MKHQKERCGYTLVELLVTIAIIVILLSLLLSIMGRAQENAMEISCKNNQKQMGMSIHEYSGDNSSRYPQAVSGNYRVTWSDRLGLYDGRNLTSDEITGQLPKSNVTTSRGAEMYQCEVDTWGRFGNRDACKISYAINANITTNSMVKSIFDVKTPSCTVVIAEFTYWQTYLGIAFNRSRKGVGTYMRSAAHQRSLGQGGKFGMHGEYEFNYLFGDGHVKKHVLQDVSSQKMWDLEVP